MVGRFLNPFFFCVTLLSPALVLSAEQIESPDGRTRLLFELQNNEDGSGFPVYRISYDGQPLLTNSRLSFLVNSERKTKGGTDAPVEFATNLTQVSAQKSDHDGSWKPVYGERSLVRDHYQELVVKLARKDDTTKVLELTFRAFDAGIAFRAKLDMGENSKVNIAEELTEFTFPADHVAWVTRNAQGIYSTKKISTMGDDVERPLTLCDDVNATKPVYIALTEAGLVDYARMKLRRSDENPLQIVSQLSGKVSLASPASTPWRVVMVGDSAGELLNNNDIILNLNEPCAIKDTSWIKPGKVIRDITLTDEGARACIEFAVKHNLQYVEFDAGWYGNEFDEASDATTITVDPKRSPGPLALKQHIAEANSKGLGVILYVNRRALEKQLDEILPLFKSWGVAGVKYGFVRVGSQQWTTWLHEAIRKAADHQLMVDVHDEYRTTGYCRTYPNLMTVEGIGGDETSPTNEQTLCQLFTRMIAGAADNKICYFNHRVEKNQNHAAQLAKAMIMYDPWQFLFWYDSASESYAKKRSDGQGVIHETVELEFWDHMPTVWDDSKVLHGRIGEHAVIARRSAAEWYVGALNAGPVTLPVKLDFLDAGKQYTAHIYSHDSTLDTRTHVRVDRKPVTRESILQIELGKNSGQAIRIEPVN